MNPSTSLAILRAIKASRKSAEKFLVGGNVDDFAWAVYGEWQDNAIGEFGVAIKERVMARLQAIHPELFDGEGYLKSYEPEYYDLEIRVSDIAVALMMRRLADDPVERYDPAGMAQEVKRLLDETAEKPKSAKAEKPKPMINQLSFGF